MPNDLVIGVDFGSDSVRAIVVDPRNNEVLGEDQPSPERTVYVDLNL